MLCRVALDTSTPATRTGSSSATGVSTPVRPTWIAMALSRVVTCSGGNFRAKAQRGARAVWPKSSCKARLFTLATTPSISKGRVLRRAWRSR